MSDEKKIIDPAGEVNEEELKESVDVEGGSALTIAVTVAVSAAFSPTTKCSSKC